MFVNTHVGPAYRCVRDVQHQICYRLRQGVFRADAASAVESALESALESAVSVGWAEVHLFDCICRVSADGLWCHYGKEDILVCGFDEA